MPPRAKPARLWLEPARADRGAVWIILDRGQKVTTGCAESDHAGAERALERYIAQKGKPVASRRHPDRITIAEVLTVYTQDCVEAQARPKEALGRIDRLGEWWGRKAVSAVTGGTCRAYAAARGNAAARRELEDLRAALNYAHGEGYLESVPAVTLPQKAQPRERWLTRSELARLIWSAWRYREVQKGHATGRRSRQHVARFILVAYYTGTRSGAICAAARAQFDLEHGLFYRRPEGEIETKKRRPTVPMQDRLLAHVSRWWRMGISRRHLIEWNGKPVGSVRKAFARAAKDAGLGAVTPHVLRHTAATHLMQADENIENAAQFLGMTPQTLRENYWHHSPSYARAVGEKLAKGR